ncbi:hypothetical protein HPP92_025740 [Vanilla planifolia]|uniref:Uncharacterized protein n=1 Tax=Vanilla planifolia TaxID=51239 RepID=A0A835UCM2_VANPL|nr:hypothetical protein HPP92_025740 [Vanilla planifolia]
MVLANAEVNLEEDSVDAHVLPASVIGYRESILLKSFINSTANPKARLIFGGTTIGRARAPAVALFSSRGPSLTLPSVPKPDVIAPGVNIIAAWPGNLGPTGLPEDRRRSDFSILSGTSMACPHASGITALVRAAHPSWSPAAVRSAIMTTTNVFDNHGKPITDGATTAGIFSMGAGHINPTKAIDPGLVYDISPNDYIVHLCSLGYTKSEMFAITHRVVDCDRAAEQSKGFDLNYPSIAVEFKKGENVVVVKRTLTNVGVENSTYAVRVKSPEGVKVTVVPNRLSFARMEERRTYKAWFVSGKRTTNADEYGEGELKWEHSWKRSYRVRSPVVVKWAA